MGQDASLPSLLESQSDISIQCEERDSVPFFIPENHPLKSANLSNNCIRKFQTILPDLCFLDLSRNSLNMLDFNNISINYNSLNKLILSANGFKKLPTQIYGLPSLVDLSLDQNELTDDTNDFSQMKNLRYLDLFLNYYKFFPKLPEGLVSLNIGFNSIKTFSLISHQIQEIRLSGNEITEFDEGISFPQLKFLDLSMNRIIELPSFSVFAPNLETLLCSYNFITKVPLDLPSSLIKIDFSHNELNFIEFRSFPKLKSLDISFNHLKFLPTLPSSLEIFNAENNLISESAQITLKHLNTLNLNSNDFTDIPDIKDSYVSTLIIRNNKIKTIETSRIGSMTKKIDITNNKIEILPIELYQFGKIQFLSLTNNMLRSLSAGMSELNLTTLFISESNISDLPILPKNLMTLVASKCNFSSIPDSVYNASRLNIIDFSNNKIEKIAKLPNVTIINLSMNSLCSIPQLSDKLGSLDLSFNQVTSVELVGDFIMIQELNLSHNHIHSFSAPVLPVLHTLKLSHNKKLQFQLIFTKFPSLKSIDITKTKITATFPLPKGIKDFSTSCKEYFDNSNNPYVRLFSCDGIGYSETIGTRPTMEDALILRQNFKNRLHVLSIIDGHGGYETASLAAHYIPSFLAEYDSISISTMSKVFRQVNSELHKRAIKDGAAVIVVIVTATEIGAAHLGDSRALIVRKNKTVLPLTNDHKLTSRSEIDLVKENRSFIESNRIAGVLAVSRSLGDFRVPGVSHIPDMTSYSRNKEDYRLVLGCDGIFDVIDNEDIGEIVMSVQNVNEAACLLRNIAFARGSQDNISAVVADISLSEQK